MKVSLSRAGCVVGSLLLASSVALHASLPIPMVGRQSHNAGIRAVPAPGAVTIDGDLSDWDWSGRIWSFADIAIRDRFSAETAVMWDKDYLYLAARFCDPSPLHNTVNPRFDPTKGWFGDAMQLRLRTDWPQWVTFWRYPEERRNSMLHEYWSTPTDASERRMVSKLRVGEPDARDIGDGVQLAYSTLPDGGGYIQEARIPWRLMFKNEPPAIAPGLTIGMGLELFWGAGSGETLWPAHRYADNLAAGETSREFFWKSPRLWGDVTLLAKGNVETLSYTPAAEKLPGTVVVRAEIPATAREFTVVIETPDGKRVRNLGAQLDAELYSVGVKDGRRAVEVNWDGLDDKGGLVAAGDYRVRGLSHGGLGAEYVMSFFNPGTPPWDTRGPGGWGSDHHVPYRVATGGDWTVIGWHEAEGGHGVIGVGPDGLKKWGEKRGTNGLTADAESVYSLLGQSIYRLNLKDGTYKPFTLAGAPRPFELPFADVFGGAERVPGEAVSVAISKRFLAIAFSGGQIALLDPASAELKKSLTVASPSAVAFSGDGKLYALTEGRLAEVDVETGTLNVIPTPGLKIAPNSGTLTVDREGNPGVYDAAGDKRVRFYSPSGKFEYAVGREGGRPARGKFDEQGMLAVSSIAVDGQGRVWATEAWDYPRRVSVWRPDGKLARDYIGNTRYAGTGTYLHDQDPTLAYYGAVEMKLDYAKRAWTVTQVLWVPDEGGHFPIIPGYSHSFTEPQRFRANIQGKDREYLFAPSQGMGRPAVVYQETPKGWQPVAAVGLVGDISGEIDRRGAKVVRQPEGEFSGRNAADGFFWNDENGDGRLQIGEVVFVTAPVKVEVGKGIPNNKRALPLLGGWGPRMSARDLSFVAGGARFVPLRYTASGAPVYGPESIKPLTDTLGGVEFVPVPEENGWFTAGNEGVGKINEQSGRMEWSYPNRYNGVHGSHRAPMPQPGLVIGPLKIMGTAALGEGRGHVFAIRGNLGQDYFFTTDGLFIGTIFQDGRLPSPALPDKESELLGTPMEIYGGGSEPFSGWFGKHDDGTFRMTSGLGRQTAMILEVNGLDKVQRFTAPTLTVDAKQLTAAAIDNDERAAAKAKAAEKRAKIVKFATAPVVDAKSASFKDAPVIEVKSTSSNLTAKARLGYDATNLYLSIEVEDPTPWRNQGVDFTRLFKTGDAVDIHLGTGPKIGGERPVQGDLRVVLSQLNGQPVAVLMQPVNPQAPKTAGKLYSSPVSDQRFDEVRVLPEVKIAVRNAGKGYRLDAAIPLASLKLKPQAGAEIRGDIGFISSDAAGMINVARTYWANQSTNLVSDEPFEALFKPSAWGVFTWGE